MQGRNLDYGKKMSSSKEGKMFRTTLLSMVKDLYSLYVSLNDEDDLPQWCHYKLARSSQELSTIERYLTSKILKHCIDNKITEKQLKKQISECIK